MRRWPIRIKLIAGFVLVVGMLLTLLGGSIYGLHSFHSTNLKLTDQLRELGSSTRLLRTVVQIEAANLDTPFGRDRLQTQVNDARRSIGEYWELLRDNASRGNRPDVHDELELARQIDDDLTAILNQLSPAAAVRPVLPVTRKLRKGDGATQASAPLTLAGRIGRLNQDVMLLPNILHRDFFGVLDASRTQWESSRVIVIVSALFVLGMTCALWVLVNRWVLCPVRLLHRGVRRVARGDFEYKIALHSGDEMQALAEAFNEMTAKLSATYKDLEQQVHERSRQLVRSERLAGVGFLAAGVAHEINNPLASIAFSSEALERRLAGPLSQSNPAEARAAANYLRMIQEEAFRCKRITEKLLDFSRCGEIVRERTDLVGLVESVVEMLQHMGKYRGKQILFHPREAVLAHVDGQEIKQVVLNLVVNALDCMEHGGTLRIDVRHAGGMAELVFDDDGCGMSAETLENIFEPFFTKRRVGKGTGLGLSITHNIVSQHGGEIMAISSGEGQGSTFTVRLPLRPPEREPKPMYDSDSIEKPGKLSASVIAAIAAMCLSLGGTSALASRMKEVRSRTELGEASIFQSTTGAWDGSTQQWNQNYIHGGYISSPVGTLWMNAAQGQTFYKGNFYWDYNNTVGGQQVSSWNAQPGDGQGWGTENTADSPSAPLIYNFSAPIQGFGATFLHDNTTWDSQIETISPARIDVYDGLDGTGNLLGSILSPGASPVAIPWRSLDFVGLVTDDESRLIRSAKISGTGPTQSFMIDAVAVKLPEPASVVVFAAIGVGACMARRRRTAAESKE